MSILNNYVCTVPFTYLEIHRHNVYGCCPSWMPEPYGDTENLSEIWNGDIATKTRESILDGSYSYCDRNNCPHLSQLYHSKIASNYFAEKSSFRSTKGPQRLNFCFDRSCNLACPSCRKEHIMSQDIENIRNILNDVSDTFRDVATSIYISGSSEPFASKVFVDFLINYNQEMFPKLTSMHLHTNGLLLDEKMWNKIEKSHKYIDTLEVSIDASTEETYRKNRGGNWNKLISNLNFISSIETISNKVFSFVVHDNNYKEMENFYEMIRNLPHKNNYSLYYGKIINWGTYTDDEYAQKQIWSENHPNFSDFLPELSKIIIKPNVLHNMNDIVEKYKLIPKPNRLI